MKKMSMGTKKEIISRYKEKYQKASRKEKSIIITETCNATGLSRDRATRLLNGSSIKRKTNKGKQGRKIFYTLDVLNALEEIWEVLYFPCGKRLTPAIIPFLDALERHNKLTYDNNVVTKLKQMSASTIDRLLVKVRHKNSLKGKSTTKPGSLLKKDIPIRLGNQWDENSPGYTEIDLVAHCGSTTAGDYVNTLDVTDIFTGWTETRAVLNKAQKHVFDALMFIKADLPFELLGIDSDNGSEFINNHLYNYCQKNNLCFTRSRPFKKNDNCHVEQKNWSVVRKHIGYHRFEGMDSVNLINQYYENLRLFTNFFLPQTKLTKRTREGAKIKKVYEQYITPYQRVLNSTKISDEAKSKLTTKFLSLNPIQLRNQMSAIQNKLIDIALPWR